MVRIDLHVHTSYGSPCAELLKPSLIQDAMRMSGIHGVVVTEHNIMWPRSDMDAMNRILPRGLRIYSGVEITTSRFHVLVIGLDSLHGITPGITPEKLLEISKKNRAAAILVHPYDSFPGQTHIADIPDFDGIEVVSTMTSGDKHLKTLALCDHMKKVPVGGSDAHCKENIGKVYTAFKSLPGDEKELAEQINKGMGRPMILTRDGKEVRIC